ncbi:MAG: hypothetical protein DWI28_00005, partial [Planctomycetota bacterium]
TSSFNSGQRIKAHFVHVTDMIAVGKGAKRPVQTVMMSRHRRLLAVMLRLTADSTDLLAIIKQEGKI